MSVGLETMLDYQRFLLEECSLKIDGRPHHVNMSPGGNMRGFLSKLSDFGRVRICAGNMQPIGLSTVEWYGERAVIWPSAQPREKVIVWPNSQPRYVDVNHGLSFTLVPEMLEIAVDSDPRKSRVVLFGSHLARDVPWKNEHGYECPEIAFYSQNVKARRDKRALLLPELPLEKRLSRLLPVLDGKYPQMDMVTYSFKAEDGHAFVNIEYVTGVRAHLEKKDMVIVHWLDKNLPLPAHVFSREEPGQNEYKGKTVIRYTIMLKLPE